MNVTPRPYSEAAGDFVRLCRFIIDDNINVRARSTWCLGRIVDWKHALYESKLVFANFCESNAFLWFDGYGQLAGFTISESGDAGVVVLTLAGYRLLFEEMLSHALEAWADRGPAFSVEITANQVAEAAVALYGALGAVGEQAAYVYER